MYKGFCITTDTIISIILDLSDQELISVARNWKILQSQKQEYSSSIKRVIVGNENGVIDGDKLQSACLPTKLENKCDIFISHSHDDGILAEFLAAYIKTKYNINCFVDGFVWGSADNDILRPLDVIHSKHKTKKDSFSYEKRNYSTSHVHAMLSMALLEMIDNCECCIFVKPDNDLVITDIDDCTISPWIYEEISMFDKVRKTIPDRLQGTDISLFENEEVTLKIRYRLDLSNMPELSISHFSDYFYDDISNPTYTPCDEWLDDLYKIKASNMLNEDNEN